MCLGVQDRGGDGRSLGLNNNFFCFSQLSKCTAELEGEKRKKGKEEKTLVGRGKGPKV